MHRKNEDVKSNVWDTRTSTIEVSLSDAINKFHKEYILAAAQQATKSNIYPTSKTLDYNLNELSKLVNESPFKSQLAPVQQICHTDVEYDRAGLNPLINHIKDYFQGNQLVPVSQTKNHLSGKYIYFVFSNKLLEQILQAPKTVKKFYESAVKYGFQGYSAGGKNGIFYQRKQDTNLLTATEKLSHVHESELKDFMQYFDDFKSLRKIKIVTHNTKGDRIVGLYNEKNAKAVFFDFAQH